MTPKQEKSFHADERGAALITMLLISLLLLTAGGALIATTTMSAVNSVDSSAETQAYYAAEAGNQAVLNLLRGNAAPSPLFVTNPSGGVAEENKINFRRAVTLSTSNLSSDPLTTDFPARLSRWLGYNYTSAGSAYADRVALTANYTPVTGMAFNATLSDPDNSAQVTFSTSGILTTWASNTHQYGLANNRFTLTYQAQSSTSISNTGTSTFGLFTLSSLGTGCNSGGCSLTNEPFTLTVTQTTPWPVTVTLNCTLSGTFTSSSSFVSVTFPTQTNSLQGAEYVRSANPVNTNSSTPISVTITAPDPNRLVATINGFGPRSAKKQMQMLLSRFAFDFSAPSTITLRSADDNSLATFNAGSSAQYQYSGFDHAGGPNLSAFGVTSTPDYLYLTGLTLPAGQVAGSPSPIQQVPIANLPSWLQTADAARAFVDQMRSSAQNENRYFTPASPPPDFGTTSHPVLTFVDGDIDLPPAGGSGLLIVTGIFSLRGSSDFKGVVLVLGAGQLLRDGGGNGNSLGAAAIARFGSSGNFLAPTFISSGSGTSSIQYDSDWVRKTLASAGPRVMAVSEF